MQIKTILTKTSVVIGILLGAVAILGIIFYMIQGSTTEEEDLFLSAEVTNIQEKHEELDLPIVGLPSRLIIPEIGIDSIVEYVGVTQEGKMDIPKGPTTTAWFDLGPRPGEEGSAVFAGHFGWKNNIPAVFDNLHKLKIGSRVYVVDENGVAVSFVVREIRSYDQDADASLVFGSDDGKAHLNLVTCQGNWSVVSQSRSNRLVVFTDKE